MRDVAAHWARLLLNGEPVAALATRRGTRALAQAFAGLGRLPRDELKTWLRALAGPPCFDVTATHVAPAGLCCARRARCVSRPTCCGRGCSSGCPRCFGTSLAYLLWLPIAAVTVVAWIVAWRAVRARVAPQLLARPRAAPRPGQADHPPSRRRWRPSAPPTISHASCAAILHPLAVAAALMPPARLPGARGGRRGADLRFRDTEACS